MIISREDARNIAKVAWELTALKVEDVDNRIKVAVAYTEVFCEGLIAMFPEKAPDGETILDKIGRAVSSYPPEKPFEEIQNDITN